ncbi:3-hydroxybutyryl-CoA dehydrogenase [Natranaerofaba carboxydovora]|uniref:3-hydroxybutyryl-CoA dehydrogenase n=1 Tax=Natranaerofaba carboxydovora TaxID=2742683 RepID=UPI001F149406|nr:3-hydroxybutyryl-CoA dehydrogenase [Natranaerofaba carboxydovora]UMZ73212.1 putative 3-hydroxybutyryl-CoA dehydrogenase [Natranaerofaba carboxydovora]
MEIKKVGVMGAGQMGAGIAQVAAQTGCEVVLRDVKEEFVEKGLAGIKKNLERSVQKERITEDEKNETLSRISTTLEVKDASDCDLIVEAIIEDLGIKQDLFKELDEYVKPEGILASNTSSCPITDIAAATNRPEKVIGMHFMNPVPVMKLVEIINGLATDENTYKIVEETAKKMNKTPVCVNDYPGFVSNRVLLPMINEAVYCLMEGVASEEDIDTVMKLGMNHPMGPLTLADLIGLDTCLSILNVLYEGLGDPKYRPCPLLKKYVSAGWVGKKVGRGFYKYE